MVCFLVCFLCVCVVHERSVSLTTGNNATKSINFSAENHIARFAKQNNLHSKSCFFAVTDIFSVTHANAEMKLHTGASFLNIDLRVVPFATSVLASENLGRVLEPSQILTCEHS